MRHKSHHKVMVHGTIMAHHASYHLQGQSNMCVAHDNVLTDHIPGTCTLA